MLEHSLGGIPKTARAGKSERRERKSLGTLYEQKFYALRAAGKTLDYPFAARTFTALVDSNTSLSDDVLRHYVDSLLNHGCIHVICRGHDAERLSSIFDETVDERGLTHDGYTMTSMIYDEDDLEETVGYFVLPTGLADVGLLLVIGDSGDFKSMVRSFARIAGTLRENVTEPVFESEVVATFRSGSGYAMA